MTHYPIAVAVDAPFSASHAVTAVPTKVKPIASPIHSSIGPMVIQEISETSAGRVVNRGDAVVASNDVWVVSGDAGVPSDDV